jgi:small-conductance mechanosensitive channel
MKRFFEFVKNSFQSLEMDIDWEKYFFAAIILIGGIVILRFITFFVSRASKKRISDQSAMLIRKTIFYAGFVILSVMVLSQLGVSLTALLGAAGIIGIAVGFAAQTSISNIISGLFLISEKSFEVGNLIKVGDTVGIVMSIDILAVKLRTFDNRYIRIPNQTIIQTELENITKFPVRRINLDLQISYNDDIEKARDILVAVARNNQHCLNEPEPFFAVKGFEESGIGLFFGVWCINDDYMALKNSIYIDIKKAFDDADISIPYPHLSITSESHAGTIPVSLDEKMKKG